MSKPTPLIGSTPHTKEQDATSALTESNYTQGV